MTMKTNPIHLPLANPIIASVLEHLIALNPLAAIYDRWLEQPLLEIPGVGEQFLDHVLESLETRIDVINADNLDKTPSQGPVIFYANHPFGGLEGMQLARLLLKYRPDLKVLTNEFLTLIPEFQDLFIGVDVLSANSVQKNVIGMKKISAHLKQQGALLIFPAGVVASLELSKMAIVEKPWTTMLARLTRKYGAATMPLYVEGRNSIYFHALGLLHKRLRTAMLPRELVNKRGKCTTVVAGTLLKQKDLLSFRNDEQLTDYMRLACESMSAINRHRSLPLPQHNDSRKEPGKNEVLLDTLATLDDCLLLAPPPFKVYCVPYGRLGPLQRELARVREITFRAAGEGTGQIEDSDRFDPNYLHLFAWDTEADRLVGAYRIGKCDEIIAAHGVAGLYSRSLFKYKQSYIERLGGALEVGRSFVSLDYQRNPRALDSLWRGIGAFVAQNPNYHTLFGCVSISSQYSVMARAFLSETMLTSFAAAPEFLTDIKPVSPLRVKGKLWTTSILASLSDIAIINKLVGSFDPGKHIPVLLRHYLALNGRFVSFTVNHGFNQALDGLILVDLRQSPFKYLQRYLGRDGAENFLKKWGANEAAA